MSLHTIVLKELIIINRLFNSKYEIYLEIALIVNKNMYDSLLIPYNIYKITEDNILKKLREWSQ